MRGLLLLASPLLAQLDIPGHRDLLSQSQDQSQMRPVQNQSSEVTQAEISSLYSGDQTRTFTVYPAVIETVSGDEQIATPQPLLPTSAFFPQNEQPVSEEEMPDVEVLERKSEAEPGYLLQGRSLGSELVFPLKHHQDLNLQRKQQALNIQKQQQQQQALEIMQQQQALQQQYMILQQQQALNLQQQNLPTIQQPYSSLKQQQPALQQPYSTLQQPYSNLQQPYSDINGQTLYQGLPNPNPQLSSLQQSYNLPTVVQTPYPAGPISFIPADEPQTSASALGGQFQPYQPTYQDQYDDIGNEQVLPLPYGELAPRADQPEEGIYPQDSYAQPQEANERGYGIGGYHHGGYGGHHPVVAPVVGHGLHRVHTHQRIPFPVPVPHPVPVPVVRAIHHQHHTAGGDGQHGHDHGHNHNHDHQHGHQHSHENSHNHVHKHTHHHDHHHNHKHHNEHVHEEKHKHGHEHAHAHAPGY